MLPARPEMNRTHINNEAPEVKPGTWWRMASEDHEWMERDIPDHGLVLMVQEARIIDGDLHTIILHPHPIWQHAGTRYNCRMLTEEFLQAFKPEPEGDALREAEIAIVMGRVQDITSEISTPPAPALLLERQTDEKAAEDARNGKTPDATKDQDSSDTSINPGNAIVPAALLPSQDVVAAQKAIENRIAEFDAQKNWITDKTTKLQREMGLVSTYQSEKVHTALAGISVQTKQAEGLLENVQTMRLFLGEDMAITSLRDGESADPSKPLTFMQRMLYLDEELFVHKIVEGFDGDMMDNLPALLQENMSLVERMLPYERSIAITRVRRKARELDIPTGSSVSDIIRALFAHVEILKADMRIQILVRDGDRMSMITCDEATSHAERLFPSRVEIDALFSTNTFSNKREITPHDLDYTDARARHDTRALFYKRFLLILWGVHERSDIFGDFTPKGSNWLDASIHSDHFHFVHDEEEVIEDDKPSIHTYFQNQNEAMRAGSRVLVNWYSAANSDTAPGACIYGRDRIEFNGGFVNDREVAIVFSEDGHLKAKAPFLKGAWDLHRSDKKPVMTKVSMRMPTQNTNRPDKLYDTDLSSGFICLDNLTLADIDYYINSRKARKDYAKYMTLFNEARIFIRDEEKHAAKILADLTPNADSTQEYIFVKAIRLWREANKWEWPETEKQKDVVRKLVDRISNPQALDALGALHEDVLRVQVKASGEIVIITDGEVKTLEGGIVTPWIREITYAGPTSKKPKSEKITSFFDLEQMGRFTTSENKAIYQGVKTRLTEEVDFVPQWPRGAKPYKVKNWLAPRAFATPGAQKGFERIAQNGKAVEDWVRVLNGDEHALAFWLDDTYERYRAPKGQVELPTHNVDLGLLYGFDSDGVPRSWALTLSCRSPEILIFHGQKEKAVEWADQIYANPRQIVDRWEGWQLGQGAPWSLQIRALGYKRSVEQGIKQGVYLSFEDGALLSNHGLPKNEDLSWRQKAARLITTPVQRGWDTKWAANDLRAKADHLHFLGAPGAEDLCAFAEDQRK
jgi:hypothetical protein